MRKTNVRTHLRRSKHGKSVVRHHRRTLRVPRRMADFSGTKELKATGETIRALEKKATEDARFKPVLAGYKKAIIDLDLQPDLEAGEVLGAKKRKEIYMKRMEGSETVKKIKEMEDSVRNIPNLPQEYKDKVIKQIDKAMEDVMAKQRPPMISNPLEDIKLKIGKVVETEKKKE